MRTTLVIMRKELMRIVRDRRALMLSLFIPFFLMLVVGAVFSTNTSGSGTTTVDLPVYVEDQGPVGQQLLMAIQQTPTLRVEIKTSAADARTLVEDGDRSAAVIIPAGVSDAVAQGKQANVTVLTTPSNRDYRALAVRGIMGNIVQNFVTSQIAGQVAVNAVKNNGGNADPNAVAQQASQQATQLSQKPPLNLQTQVAKQNQSDNNYDQVVPGYALMFALFAVGAGAGTILDEKEAGTWKRLLVAPVSRWALLGGKLGAQFVRALAQIGLLFLVGKLLFHIDLGSVPAIILLIVVTAFATTALGMLLVSVVKTRDQLQPITTLVVLTFSALGGSWFPLFLMPTWVQQVSKVTLTSWAMQGFNNLMIFGKGFAAVLPSMLVLAAYGVVCFLLAIRFFRFQEAT
ncbi:MAG: ABC transporter permease [Thermomicrobiales bacterium]